MKSSRGFTLMELLIVITLISILAVVLYYSQRVQLSKGYDAVRKSDLNKIKIALESYYADKGCYPPQSAFNNCGSADLAPYLNKVPCDPETRKPYNIKTDGTACSQKYYLYGTASNWQDPGITCNGKYYVASTNVSDAELNAICTGQGFCSGGWYACINYACVLVSQIDTPKCSPVFCVSNCQNSCNRTSFQARPLPCL